MTPMKRYWDSNAFLGWLNKEPHCFDVCDGIIRDARSGKCRIVTSTITFAEVFWVRGGAPKQEQVNAIKNLFGHICLLNNYYINSNFKINFLFK